MPCHGPFSFSSSFLLRSMHQLALYKSQAILSLLLDKTSQVAFMKSTYWKTGLVGLSATCK